MGRKRALLVGINYPGTRAELRGCVNDVARMHRCLVERFGFDDADVRVLVDADPARPQPTGANIRRALAQLVESARPGDALFFHYSGHGTRLPAETGEEDDTGYDECIVPCDMNLITDHDFRELVQKVPDGCLFTMVTDSCHSGGLLDKAKEQIGNSTKENHTPTPHRERDERPDSGTGFRSFLKETVRDIFESEGTHLRRDRQPPPSSHGHGHSHSGAEEQRGAYPQPPVRGRGHYGAEGQYGAYPQPPVPGHGRYGAEEQYGAYPQPPVPGHGRYGAEEQYGAYPQPAMHGHGSYGAEEQYSAYPQPAMHGPGHYRAEEQHGAYPPPAIHGTSHYRAEEQHGAYPPPAMHGRGQGQYGAEEQYGAYAEPAMHGRGHGQYGVEEQYGAYPQPAMHGHGDYRAEEQYGAYPQPPVHGHGRYGVEEQYGAYPQPAMHGHGHYGTEEPYGGYAQPAMHGRIKNRSLPLSTLIEMLKEKTGKDNIDVGSIRMTLFNLFGDDASPKIKKFMKVMLDKLGQHRHGESTGGVLGIVGALAQEFFKAKLDGNEGADALKPAMRQEVHSTQEVYAGTKTRAPDNGVLISGCQTDQTSADATTPQGASYGALSNAIQAILADKRGQVTNRELVLRAREMLSKQGYAQQPGLYCTDEHVNVAFIC